MLLELRIKNFAIIDDLSINFESGINVLTGETGAGKSIIVDAIGLILGDKSSSDSVRTGAKEASIEAYFSKKNLAFFEELNINSDDGIIIRRNISAQGKSRAYINDISVSLPTLTAVGECLIDIHGQHEHQGLLKKDNHLVFLDSIAGLSESTTFMNALYNEVVSLRNKVAELKERVRERNQKIDFLRFQINEIDSANLRSGEKESIEEEMRILLNLNRLRESSEAAYSILYDSEGSCLEQMTDAISKMRDMANFDMDANEPLDIVESITPQLKDAILLIRRLKDKYEIDPKRLSELDERLDLIKRLEMKYGNGVDEVLKYRDKIEEDLKTIEHAEDQKEALESELILKEKELKMLAEELSLKRQTASKKMEKMVVSELHKLGFQKAEFKVVIKKRDTIMASGIDDIEFLFSANAGEPARPLIKVASGGELSRIMLALKCVEINGGFKDSSGQGVNLTRTLEPSNPQTLIFDEVDAGIGGVTAQHVARRLKDISNKYQVICVTHLPQIAAMADNHLKVEKTVENGFVKVSVVHLSGNERQDEIARMMSGNITEVSLKHAAELLSCRFQGTIGKEG